MSETRFGSREVAEQIALGIQRETERILALIAGMEETVEDEYDIGFRDALDTLKVKIKATR